MAGWLLYLFLRTNIGTAMRAAGDNPQMIRALGVSVDTFLIFGLALSNGLIALAGAMLAQYQGFADVPPAAAVLANLALEELVTNTIKYGYDDGAEHFVDVEMSLRDGQLVLQFTDDGREFNPVEAAPPDLTLPLEERPIGGLGLHLLRTMSDRMTYERRGSLNCVTLTKTLTDKP